MKVTLHTENAEIRNGKHEDKIIKLTDYLKLNLDRIPCKGETLGLCIGDYILETTVQEVSTSWSEPGNKNFRKEYWGATYDLWLDSIEVVEHLKKTKITPDTGLMARNLSDPMFRLHKRILNPLAAAGITTVGHLCSKSKAELLEVRNIGKETILELEAFLKGCGLGLKN